MEVKLLSSSDVMIDGADGDWAKIGDKRGSSFKVEPKRLNRFQVKAAGKWNTVRNYRRFTKQYQIRLKKKKKA